MSEEYQLYDNLFEEDPYIQKLKQRWIEQAQAKVLQQGLIEGRTLGRVNTMRDVVLDRAQRHFPHLLELAQQRVPQITNETLLWKLFRSLASTSNEATARRLLESAGEQE